MYRIIVSEIRRGWFRQDRFREILDIMTDDPEIVEQYRQRYSDVDHRITTCHYIDGTF